MTLRFRCRRRELPFNDLRLKIPVPVGMIAKRLVLAQAATAERDGGPSGEIELVPLLVDQLEISLDFDAPVALHRDSCRHRSLILLIWRKNSSCCFGS